MSFLDPENHDYAWSIYGTVDRPCVVCGQHEQDHLENTN